MPIVRTIGLADVGCTLRGDPRYGTVHLSFGYYNPEKSKHDTFDITVKAGRIFDFAKYLCEVASYASQPVREDTPVPVGPTIPYRTDP